MDLESTIFTVHSGCTRFIESFKVRAVDYLWPSPASIVSMIIFFSFKSLLFASLLMTQDKKIEQEIKIRFKIILVYMILCPNLFLLHVQPLYSHDESHIKLVRLKQCPKIELQIYPM